jgi:hypothetical protein
MRSVENRVARLEAELGDKTSAVQFLVVPREVPREKWDEYVEGNGDGRPLFVFPEGLSLEECMAECGVVEIEAE